MEISKAFGILAVIFMVLSIFAGIVAMNNVYQHEWRKKFAWAHLDLAEASSDIATQYAEVSNAITILDAFPKNGNWDLLNKLNPKTNMANAWKALYEVENYTLITVGLDKSDAAYNIAVYNNQEKIQYVEEQYETAFNDYITWGLGGWINGVAIVLGIFWLIFWFLAMIASSSLIEGLVWCLTSLPLWFVIAFIIYAGYSPIFYGGPT